MHELTLTWIEKGQRKTQTIYAQQPSKNPGTVRIGRDPARCDIVLTDMTVSGLHVEIFFNPQEQGFSLRNLRQGNPPIVDGQTVVRGEVTLRQGSTIHLGQIVLTILALSIATAGVAATIVMQPQHLKAVNQPSVPVAPIYALRCPNYKCGKTSPYARLDLGCPWCGTSLAAAASVLMTPGTH
ncbi:MAG: hypothetical protein NVS2B14_07130 [Chamaesiphon sp.]